MIDRDAGIAAEPDESPGIGPLPLQLPVPQLVSLIEQPASTVQTSFEMHPVHTPTPVILPALQWTSNLDAEASTSDGFIGMYRGDM